MSKIDPENSAQDELWQNFYFVNKHLERSIERELQATAEISSADFEILVALGNSPTGHLLGKEIARFTGWEKSRISHQLKRMIARGLVLKGVCSTDARSSSVQISPQGEKSLKIAIKSYNKVVTDMHKGLINSTEEATLARVSRKLRKSIESAC